MGKKIKNKLRSPMLQRRKKDRHDQAADQGLALTTW
jgi:hypothetical protein